MIWARTCRPQAMASLVPILLILILPSERPLNCQSIENQALMSSTRLPSTGQVLSRIVGASWYGAAPAGAGVSGRPVG